MKNIFKILVVSWCLIFIGCSKDDSSGGANGFTVNGTFYSTPFAYTQVGSNGPNRVWVFSSIDRSLSTYTEDRGRFDFRLFDNELSPGNYSTGVGSLGDIFEFTKDIQKVDGDFVSFGDDLAVSIGGRPPFRSGSVVVNSVTLGADGLATQIDLEYVFEWDDVTVRGNYSGPVSENP